MDKQGYVSPSAGEMTIVVTRDAHPCITIAVDLGIPNFTVFSLRFPFAVDEPNAMSELVMAALRVLLDDIAAFMLSQSFPEMVVVDVYSRILNCWTGMNIDDDTDESLTTMSDNVVKTYESKFQLPQQFINTTQERIITGGSKIFRRTPSLLPKRELELTYMDTRPQNAGDAARVIRMYRNRILRHQPNPLYVLLYDMKGRPVGVQQVKTGPTVKIVEKVPVFETKLLHRKR